LPYRDGTGAVCRGPGLPHPGPLHAEPHRRPVIARSGRDQLLDWRSAIAFDGAAIIDDPDEKRAGRGQVNG